MKIALAREQLALRRRNAASQPGELGAPLVHREGAAQNARAGIRNANQLERSLDRPILAVTAVQRDEDAVEPIFDERVESPLLRVEGVSIHAFFPKSGEHHSAAFQRHGALGRAPAREHGDLSKVAHTASPMIRTSGTNSKPKRRLTASRACSISASMSAARAFPFGLTMKFACFSEMRAPPISWPLSPLASTRRAAWSPGGLRNTEPAFGSSSGCSSMRFASSSLMRALARFSSPGRKRNQAARNHSSSPSLDPRTSTPR